MLVAARSARSARLARALSSRAAAVKKLQDRQKAVAAAVDSLGDGASLSKVQALVDSNADFKATVDEVKAADLSWTWARLSSKPGSGAPVTVAVTGAGTPAGAAALYRIAAGEMLGPETSVVLQAVGADAAVVKDLEACDFPLLKSVSAAAVGSAFKGAAYALLLDGDMGALGKAAAGGASGVLVGVLGNTNALAAQKASGLPASQFSSITRHAQMAGEQALSKAAGSEKVSNVIAWGAGVADLSHAVVDGKWALKQEGVEALPATGEASPELVAEAAVAHMKDWALGSDGKWVSMGVPATGDYGLGEGIFYSVPVTCAPGEYKRVGGVTMAPEVAAVLESSRTALAAEAAKM